MKLRVVTNQMLLIRVEKYSVSNQRAWEEVREQREGGGGGGGYEKIQI